MKLPIHLVGIFNETPRLLPKGIFLGHLNNMARSRTLSMFSSNTSSNFRGSVPDLSRSVPTTPMFTFRHDRGKLMGDLKSTSATTPRNINNSKLVPEYKTLTSDMNQELSFLDEKDKLVEIKTTPSLSAVKCLQEETPPLTTFKSPCSSNTTINACQNRDDIIINRFSKTNDDLVKLRNQPASILHSSSSFIIKRPSYLPERTSTISNSHSIQNLQNIHSSKNSDEKYTNLAGQKAAALLAEVQPSLRASTKCEINYIEAENEDSYQGLLLQNAPKYAIPRVATNTTEKRDSIKMDSFAA